MAPMSEPARYPSHAGRSAAALLALAALVLGGAVSRAASDNPSAGTAPATAHARQHGAGAKATAPQAGSGAATTKPRAASAFTGDRAETERLIAYDQSIQLTAAQEKVRLDALTPLAAPCCKEFSAATCCCRCNMMRARDGLAKHLIADLGADATKVRADVTAWHQAINPDGFEGDSCSTGKCGRAFKADDCGGMVDGQLVH